MSVKITPELLADLKDKAQKATHLKWQNNFDGITCSNLVLAIEEHSKAHLIGRIMDFNNAEYIAAANPAVILALVARIEEKN